MKRISLEQLQAESGSVNYPEQYQYICGLIRADRIRPVKSSPRNGKSPALHMSYWRMEETPDYGEILEEITYRLSPLIRMDYYQAHPAVYQEEAPWVRRLSSFLLETGGRPEEPVSLNERSFQIFGREKFLQREHGKKILTHCGLSLQDLNVYGTTEPLAYYSHSRKVPQNVLILENKDTFYSMRRHLLCGGSTIFGEEISTVIYGAGKSILRSSEDFGFCVEPHINDASNRILYFGDLDYEGIGIYERLYDVFQSRNAGDSDAQKVRPFVEAYLRMTKKAASCGEDFLPQMREKQNRNLRGTFFSAFPEEWTAGVCQMLSAGRYIPQEILNITDF